MRMAQPQQQHANGSKVPLGSIWVYSQELVVSSFEVCSKREYLVSNHIEFWTFVILDFYWDFYHGDLNYYFPVAGWLEIIQDLEDHGYVEELKMRRKKMLLLLTFRYDDRIGNFRVAPNQIIKYCLFCSVAYKVILQKTEQENEKKHRYAIKQDFRYRKCRNIETMG